MFVLHAVFEPGIFVGRAIGQDSETIPHGQATFRDGASLEGASKELMLTETATSTDTTKRSESDRTLAIWQWLGLDATTWGDAHDEESAANRHLQLRMLHELPRIPWSVWHPAGSTANGASVVRPAVTESGQIVTFAGELLELRNVDVLEADRRGLSFDRFFAGTLRTSDGESVRFAARDVPRNWQQRESEIPDHPVDCRLEGLCLNRATDERGPLIVTPRVESRPRQPDPYWGVSNDRVWLAQHGIDLGTLQQVGDRSPLSVSDQEAFYGLLSLTARESAAAHRSPNPWDLVAILPAPAGFRGDFGHITGTLRRAVRVVISDRERILRYGLAEYYQLDIFVRTSRAIRYQLPDKSTRDFGTSYPVSICVPTLPADIAEGENLRIDVQVPCIFLKLWAHTSDFMALERTATPTDSVHKHQVQQWTPLFIGWTPHRVTVPVTSPLAQLGPGLYVVVLVVLLGTLAWYFERSLPTRRRRS